MAQRLTKCWYNGPGLLSVALLPLSGIFFLLATVRRLMYRYSILKSVGLPVPVIVVGNITAGGTGKTPLVMALVDSLQQAGYKPGIISRGYGGQSDTWPRVVDRASDPGEVGDEPVLLAQRCDCPIVVGPSRYQDAKLLLQQSDCDVVVCDDGLQHYALKRDIEIVVIDSIRRFGNGRYLPAGPLREPVSRLKTVDLVVANGTAQGNEFCMQLVFKRLHRLDDPSISRSLDDFRNIEVDAIAGIGNPQRFFQQLKRMGINIREHAFADHYQYAAEDIDFNGSQAIIMTEKDAVKCRKFANERMWVLPVEADIEQKLFDELLIKLNERVNNG